MNQAVQISVSHAGVGVLMGTFVEILVPKHDETKSMNMQAFEFAVQAGLNGALIAIAAPYLSEEDPTAGGIFFSALWQSQPEWRKRVTAASQLASEQIQKVTGPLLQMA